MQVLCFTQVSNFLCMYYHYSCVTGFWVVFFCSTQEWIRRTGRKEYLRLTDKQVHERRVCSRHFAQEDFLVSGSKKILKSTALPFDINDNLPSEQLLNSLQKRSKNAPQGPVEPQPPRDSSSSCQQENSENCLSARQSSLPSTSTSKNNVTSRNFLSHKRSFQSVAAEQVTPPCTNPRSKAQPFSYVSSNSTFLSQFAFKSRDTPPSKLQSQVQSSFRHALSSKLIFPSTDNIPTTHSQGSQQISAPASQCSTVNRRVKIQKVLTPYEQSLADQVSTWRKKARHWKQKFIRKSEECDREKKVTADILKQYVREFFDKEEQKDLRTLIEMQIDHSKKCKWESDEKLLSLSIYYISPRCYRFLRDQKGLALPSVSFIREIVNSLNLLPGINTDLMLRIKLKAEKLFSWELDCSLMWDDMTIKMGVAYDPKNDRIVGIQDLGSLGRSPQVAKYACLFAIRGVRSSWKLPVCHYFAARPIKGKILATLIVEVIRALHNSGLKVRTCVCDQSQSNRGAIKALGVTAKKPYFFVDGRKIYHQFDVPHLVKSFRNNLKDKDFVLGNQIVSWRPIAELFQAEVDSSIRAGFKLTHAHMNPVVFKKQNVRLAAQVFSKSTSTAMLAAVETGAVKDPTGKISGKFLNMVNDTFDGCNSRHIKEKCPTKRPLSDKNPQIEQTLREALDWLPTLSIKNENRNPPCFKGFIHSINSTLLLWNDLKAEGADYLLTSHLNQDVEENTFGTLRRRTGSNDNPTALQFQKNLQHVVIANIVKPNKNSNCEADGIRHMLIEPMTPDHDSNVSFPSDVSNVSSGETPAEDNTVSDPIPSSTGTALASLGSIETPHEAQQFASCSTHFEDQIFDEIDFSEEVLDEDPVSHEYFIPVDLEEAFEDDEFESGDWGDWNDEEVEDSEVSSKKALTLTYPKISRLEEFAIMYVAGWLARSCLEKFKCSTCKIKLIDPTKKYQNVEHCLIFLRTWWKYPDNEFGNLKVPSNDLFELVKLAVTVFEKHFPENFCSETLGVLIKGEILQAFKKHDAFARLFGDGCEAHCDYIIQKFWNLQIFSALKRMVVHLKSEGVNESSKCKNYFEERKDRKMMKMTSQ